MTKIKSSPTVTNLPRAYYSWKPRVSGTRHIVKKHVMPDPREGEQRYITGYTFKYLQRFITKAENIQLPAWWAENKRAECEELAKELWHWDGVDARVLTESWEPREV